MMAMTMMLAMRHPDPIQEILTYHSTPENPLVEPQLSNIKTYLTASRHSYFVFAVLPI